MRDDLLRINEYDGSSVMFAHEKYDGINLKISWVGGRETARDGLQAMTRTPTDIIDSLLPCGWLDTLRRHLPGTATVHGELYVPGRKSSQVKSAMAHEPSALRFAGFAIDHHSIDGQAPLHEVNAKLSSWGIQTIPYLVNRGLQYEGFGGSGWFDEPEWLIKGTLPDDVEGYVLKNGNLYGWHKLKPVRTIDLIVRGYTDGKKANLGLVGSMKVETFEGIEVAAISGMNMETRLDVSEDRERYIGQVCEVAYQYVGDKGRLRHPNFVQWRDDKPASGCTLDQDTELFTFWFNDFIERCSG